MSNPLVILLALSLTWLCVFALAWCYGQLAVKVEHIEETIRVLVANLSGQQQEGDATHGPR